MRPFYFLSFLRMREPSKGHTAPHLGINGVSVVDFDRDYWSSFKYLLRYDPDQVQLLYATPHRWTPFYA